MHPNCTQINEVGFRELQRQSREDQPVINQSTKRSADFWNMAGTTRLELATSAVERQWPLERRCSSARRPPAQNGDQTREAGSTKDKQTVRRDKALNGKALSDIPALKPYRENPPYGILGRAMETSASFESRYAPLPYPNLTCPRSLDHTTFTFEATEAALPMRWRSSSKYRIN